MANLNKIIMIGRLVKDVECKETNNTFLHKFSIANSYYNYQTKAEDVNYFNCIYFNRTSLFQYLKKGQLICITGSLRQEKYQDNNGVVKYNIKIIANEIELLGSKKENNENANTSTSNIQNSQDYMDAGFDDVPF